MASVLGFNFNNPVAGLGLGSSSTWMLVGALIVFMCIVGIVSYFVFMSLIYNKKIIIFENISGRGYHTSGKDTAKVVKVGNGGEELFYLRNRRVFRTAYGKKMGKNEYWFAVGQDGYWYNVTLGDLDAKMGMLDIEPTGGDVRLVHVAIRKNIIDRYRKLNFMEKYGVLLVGGITVLIMMGMFIYAISKMANVVSQLPPLLQSAKDLTTAVGNACGNVNGGIIPA